MNEKNAHGAKCLFQIKVIWWLVGGHGSGLATLCELAGNEACLLDRRKIVLHAFVRLQAGFAVAVRLNLKLV